MRALCASHPWYAYGSGRPNCLSASGTGLHQFGPQAWEFISSCGNGYYGGQTFTTAATTYVFPARFIPTSIFFLPLPLLCLLGFARGRSLAPRLRLSPPGWRQRVPASLPGDELVFFPLNLSFYLSPYPVSLSLYFAGFRADREQELLS